MVPRNCPPLVPCLTQLRPREGRQGPHPTVPASLGCCCSGGTAVGTPRTSAVCCEARKPSRTEISKGCISQRLEASRWANGRLRVWGDPQTATVGPGKLEVGRLAVGVLRGRFRGISGVLCSVLSWKRGQKLGNLSVINHVRPCGPVCKHDSA